jgi:hypothetical protein
MSQSSTRPWRQSITALYVAVVGAGREGGAGREAGDVGVAVDDVVDSGYGRRRGVELAEPATEAGVGDDAEPPLADEGGADEARWLRWREERRSISSMSSSIISAAIAMVSWRLFRASDFASRTDFASALASSPAASSVARPPADLYGSLALDSRNGRVLLQTSPWAREFFFMSVWDPITDEHVNLAPMPRDPSPNGCGWNAAVLCAAAAGGGDCDHLGCRHFIVVFVGCDAAKRMFTRIYSSESRRWSEVDSAKSLSLPIHGNGDLQFDQPVCLQGTRSTFCFADQMES